MSTATRWFYVLFSIAVVWVLFVVYFMSASGGVGAGHAADSSSLKALQKQIDELTMENQQLLTDMQRQYKVIVDTQASAASARPDSCPECPKPPPPPPPPAPKPCPPAPTCPSAGSAAFGAGLLPTDPLFNELTSPDNLTPRTKANVVRHPRVFKHIPVVTKDLIARAKSPQLVLTYNSHFFGDIYGETQCPIKCMWTNDQNRIKEADGVWFHIPTFGGVPQTKYPGQKWIGMSMEGEAYYPNVADKNFLRQFDLTMTYFLDSDVPTPYPSWAEYDFLKPLVNKTGIEPVAFVASNCGPRNRRNEYVQELMKYIPVASYGRCFHNKDFGPGESKEDVLRKHKFYLAFDNSNTYDYVTEKYFHGLVAGTVPIYMGAPNIRDFMPSPHSTIHVEDFKSPKELAEYLKVLDANENLYQEYLEWKRTGPSQSFLDLVDISQLHSRCRLCIKLAQLQLGLDDKCRPLTD